MTMTDSQKWLIAALLVALSWLLYRLAPILMPFVIAGVLAYVGDPLVDKLETYRYQNYQLNRTMAVMVVFSAIFLGLATLLIIVIPTIELQMGEFIDKLPASISWLNRSVIPVLQKYLGRSVRPVQTDQLIVLIRSYWQTAGGSGSDQNLIVSVSHSGAVIIGWVMNLLLIPVISFYLLRDWDELMIKIHNLFPRRYADTVSALANEADNVLAAFMRGQFYVMLAMSLIYTVGLWLVDLELALLIGMLAGLISFVPYMGVITGVILAAITALLQFQDAMHLVPILIVFGVGHSLEGMFLTPWLVGNKIGLHPVVVIFSVLAGGQLFGFLGVLLALPVASVMMVLIRHIHDLYTDSHFYSR